MPKITSKNRSEDVLLERLHAWEKANKALEEKLADLIKENSALRMDNIYLGRGVSPTPITTLTYHRGRVRQELETLIYFERGKNQSLQEEIANATTENQTLQKENAFWIAELLPTKDKFPPGHLSSETRPSFFSPTRLRNMATFPLSVVVKTEEGQDDSPLPSVGLNS